MKLRLLKSLAPIAFGLAACLLAIGILAAAPAPARVHAASSQFGNVSPIRAARVQVSMSAVVTPFVRLPIVIGGVNLKNGGFEQGPTAWITQSINSSDPLIYQDADLMQETAPHTGDWAAWLGDRNNENAILRQIVLVPASAPQLAAHSEPSQSID